MFGFGTDLCNWISIFYNGISSAVVNNGHISESFSIKRGVRQGDPLSPYIFLIAVECLSAAMKINPDIKGIKIDQTEYLMNQYADDTTIILDGSVSSLEGTLNTLKKFENCSGLKINIDKTNAVWIGSKRQSREKLLHNLKLKWNWEGKFKLLGIQYNLSKENILAEHFTIYHIEINRILNNWKLRKLTIVGK